MPNNPATADPNKPRRRWFQFRLRTMLVGLVLLAVPCGYIGWQLKIVQQRRAMLTFIVHERGGYSSAFTDEEFEPRTRGMTRRIHEGNHAVVLQLRRTLGDVDVIEISVPRNLAPDAIARIEDLFPEADILQASD